MRAKHRQSIGLFKVGSRAAIAAWMFACFCQSLSLEP